MTRYEIAVRLKREDESVSHHERMGGSLHLVMISPQCNIDIHVYFNRQLSLLPRGCVKVLTVGRGEGQ